jgi:hypothetical protein
VDAFVWTKSVDPADTGEFFGSLRKAIARERDAAGGKDLIGVLRFDGHGGSMQRFAFARAVARSFPDTARVIDIGTLTGSMVDYDQVVGQDEVSVLRMPPARYDDLVPLLRSELDILYTAFYIVKGYSRDPVIQGNMDKVLEGSGLAEAAEKVPFIYNRLGELGKTTWELMSMSSGIEVTPADMWLPTDTLAVRSSVR